MREGMKRRGRILLLWAFGCVLSATLAGWSVPSYSQQYIQGAFVDDFERSALCVDWYSGNWEFWVLNGSGSPSYFYGEGTVTSGPGYMRLVGIPGGPYTINLTYYTNVNRAVATFGCRLCRPSAVGSALYDKDTTDDEWYCGGESRPN